MVCHLYRLFLEGSTELPDSSEPLALSKVVVYEVEVAVP